LRVKESYVINVRVQTTTIIGWGKMRAKGAITWAVVGLAWLIFLGMQGVHPAWAQGGGANVFQSYAKPLPLPDFALEDLQGKMVQIKDHKGKVILLHFWATW